MTNDEIKEKVTAILLAEGEKHPHYFSNLDVEVKHNDDSMVVIRIQDMYEAPPFNSTVIFELCDLFKTRHIDSDRFDYGGCETCDYGSRYGYNLMVYLPKHEDAAPT